jgi:hypothetical protein
MARLPGGPSLGRLERARLGDSPDHDGRISQLAPRGRLSHTALLIGPKPALLRALERAFGDAARASRFLTVTLAEAGLADVPSGELEFETFVRADVLSRLVAILPLESVHDVVRRVLGSEGDLHAPPLRPHGAVATSEQRALQRPRVVVVSSQPRELRSRAQALVASGFDVETLTHAARLLMVEPFHVVVMPLDRDGEDLALTLADARTRAGLVTFDDREHRDAVRRVLDRWPNDRFAIAPAAATPSVICGRVRTVVP